MCGSSLSGSGAGVDIRRPFAGVSARCRSIAWNSPAIKAGVEALWMSVFSAVVCAGAGWSGALVVGAWVGEVRGVTGAARVLVVAIGGLKNGAGLELPGDWKWEATSLCRAVHVHVVVCCAFSQEVLYSGGLVCGGWIAQREARLLLVAITIVRKLVGDANKWEFRCVGCL